MTLPTIPIARTLQGKSLTARQAYDQGLRQGASLRCSSCSGRVCLAGRPSPGPRQQSCHFRHVVEPTGSCCYVGGGPSSEHEQAVHQIHARLLDCLGSSVALGISCPEHRHSQSVQVDLPVDAQIALNCSIDGSNRRPDVAVLSSIGQPLLVVEVCHTHSVDGLKSDAYASAGVRWVEVASVDANTSGPLPCCAHGGFAALRCCLSAAVSSTAAPPMPAAAKRPEVELPSVEEILAAGPIPGLGPALDQWIRANPGKYWPLLNAGFFALSGTSSYALMDPPSTSMEQE